MSLEGGRGGEGGERGRDGGREEMRNRDPNKEPLSLAQMKTVLNS